MTEILLLERDLFFVAKVRATLAAAGYACAVASSADALAARLAAEPHPALALIHFGAPGMEWERGIMLARAAGVPVLAYGSHVDLAAQTAARAAGATRVIANSKLAADLPGQVAQTLARASLSPPSIS
jgi:DNA-binding response OmpR family regulator